MVDHLSKQRIWPLFAVAALVVALGGWLAFDAEPPAAMERVLEQPFLAPMPPTPVVVEQGATKLERGTTEHELTAVLRQEQQTGEHLARTAFEFVVREGAADRVGDDLIWVRRYDEVEVTMWADDVPMGVEISREAERLLETAQLEVRARPTGEVVTTNIMSAESAQLRQVLSIVGEALELAQPRFPREAVHPGEAWSWRVPVTVRGPQADTASGNTEVSARVLGEMEGGVAIGFELSGHASLNLATPTGPARVEAAGTGRGLAVWDAEASRLVESDLFWEHAVDGVNTRVRVHLEARGHRD